MTPQAQARSLKVIADESGFSLVEVLVSAAVFVVVFIMLATLFAQATSGFSGARVLSATLLAQSALQEAVSSETPQSSKWEVESNGIMWEVEQVIEESSPFTVNATVTVKRISEGKIYATLWTKLYRPPVR